MNHTVIWFLYGLVSKDYQDQCNTKVCSLNLNNSVWANYINCFNQVSISKSHQPALNGFISLQENTKYKFSKVKNKNITRLEKNPPTHTKNNMKGQRTVMLIHPSAAHWMKPQRKFVKNLLLTVQVSYCNCLCTTIIIVENSILW